MAKGEHKNGAAKPRAAKGDAPAGPGTPPARDGLPPIIPLGALLGQPSAINTLRRSLEGGRVHHAWVFHGPAGVGKMTAARAFAAELLGLDTAAAAASPDLHIITRQTARFSSNPVVRAQKQSTIPIDVLREFVIEPATLSRLAVRDSAAGKVFIIDEAEIMNQAGQNAILKTLEEPAPGTVLILVSTNEDELFPTVRSRCQRVAFFPLTDADMARWLANSGRDVPAADRAALFALAAGSPGAALLAIDNHLLDWQRTLAPLLAKLSAGQRAATLGTAMTKLVEEQVATTMDAAPETSKEAANRLWTGRMLAFVARWAQQDLRAAAKSPQSVSPARALHAVDLLNSAQDQIDFNVRFSDTLENLAVQLGQPVHAHA
ncbi:MAG: ATP-binding protein [Phycisphaerales bacterium]